MEDNFWNDIKEGEDVEAYIARTLAEAADQNRSEAFSSFISRPNRGE